MSVSRFSATGNTLSGLGEGWHMGTACRRQDMTQKVLFTAHGRRRIEMSPTRLLTRCEFSGH